MSDTWRKVAFAASISFLLLIGTTQASPATQIKILSGSAIQPAMAKLITMFERSTGHKVTFDFDGAIGGVTERVRRGEIADVVIVSSSQLESLENQGRVVAGTRVNIARVGIGIFVRKGTPKPKIDTIDAFKRTMRAAKTIGWNDPEAGAPVSLYMIGLLERLGIAEEMKPKTIAFKQRSERFEAVARGDVEIGFNQISEIMVATGIDFVGPLPESIQYYTAFAGGVVATSVARDASKALIRFISSGDAAAIWRASGFKVP